MPKLTDKNRLSIINPKLCKEWDFNKNKDLVPSNVSIGIVKKVWWICCNKHSWEDTVSHRMKGRGCPYCSGRRVSDSNRLSITHPKIAKEWHPIKNGNLLPSEVCCSVKRKVWWKCRDGHEYEMPIEKRTNYQHQGCPYCSGKIVTDTNRFSLLYPAIAREWDYNKNYPLIPENFSYASNKIIWWKCKNGHEWKTAIGSRTNRVHGCPSCNKIELFDGKVFDSMSEAYFYLTQLKGKFKIILMDKRYGIANKTRYDFFIPETNTYFEITGYEKASTVYGNKIWEKYYKNILKKKEFVECVLKANFKFIKIKLSKKQKLYVKNNSV